MKIFGLPVTIHCNKGCRKITQTEKNYSPMTIGVFCSTPYKVVLSCKTLSHIYFFNEEGTYTLS